MHLAECNHAHATSREGSRLLLEALDTCGEEKPEALAKLVPPEGMHPPATKFFARTPDV